MDSKNLFLFSVDVEDFPVIEDGQEAWAGRVDLLLERYFKFLDSRKMKATFFVLGSVAEKNPEIIQKIISSGHEVGCHGYNHIPLDKHTPETFKEDLIKAITVFKSAGVTRVEGYRAPFLSMTKKSKWAYEILKDLGFEYSSSVLPRYNPLYGWPGFGQEAKKIGGLWELPVSLMPFPIGIPAIAGVYFRVMPHWLIKNLMKSFIKKNLPVLSYFHPYDIDYDPKSRTCSWLKRNPVGNFFIFYNRKSLISRLEKVMENNFHILTYRQYLNDFIKNGV